MFNLYYIDPFTGKQLLKARFATLKQVKVAWLARENKDYILQVTEEKVVNTLPVRPRQTFQNYN